MPVVLRVTGGLRFLGRMLLTLRGRGGGGIEVLDVVDVVVDRNGRVGGRIVLEGGGALLLFDTLPARVNLEVVLGELF